MILIRVHLNAAQMKSALLYEEIMPSVNVYIKTRTIYNNNNKK